MTDINHFPEHLAKLSREDWSRLFSLLNEIDQTQNFGEVRGMEKISEGRYTGPYIASSVVVREFMSIVNNLGIAPVFDWTIWEEGKAILENSRQDYEALDVLTLCKLLTVLIRANRFTEGLLVSYFENGVVAKIITALKNKVEYPTHSFE